MTRLQFLLSLAAPLTAAAPRKSKHIVLISGDEEYRSEEALPQLAKILTTYHGFRCTVLYAIDVAAPGWPEMMLVNTPRCPTLRPCRV